MLSTANSFKLMIEVFLIMMFIIYFYVYIYIMMYSNKYKVMKIFSYAVSE